MGQSTSRCGRQTRARSRGKVRAPLPKGTPTVRPSALRPFAPQVARLFKLEHVRSPWEAQRPVQMSLAAHMYNDAIVFPFRRPGGRNQPARRGNVGRQIGGAVTRDRHDIEESALFRSGQRLVYPPIEFGETNNMMQGEYIFGGYASPLFGHFILESCTYLWYARQRPDLPILWSRFPKLLPYQDEILTLLGIDNKHVRVKEPSSVEALHVPEPGCIIRHQLDEHHAEFLGQYRPRDEWRPHGPKIWLSRSALPKKNEVVF
ncbi:hypothetical protein DLJ53_34430 [Acuticoccus sediminis]|uniref:Uncharacterized protein n=1 Tax=Acuticoccus sediminis TaxID=2184697 RepID=A0A8B2NJ79_9HYPH|nr:hypothetical protein DLJ53_34430 [Acuticoccus sediminis]